MADNKSSGKPFLIIAGAVAVLAALSFIPWGALTGNFFKDYDLTEDISTVKKERAETDEQIDPALAEAEKLLAQEAADETARHAAETAVHEGAEVPDSLMRPVIDPRRGDLVTFEDYTLEGHGLRNLKAALDRRGTRPARIAVIGDSYIEGDLFTQDIRSLLQEKYGGRGVGYVTPHNMVSGFRQSVHQTDKGWTDHDLRKDTQHDSRWLSGQRFSGEPGATVTWKASKTPAHADGWNTATILFRAPAAGVIVTDTGTGPVEHPVQPSDAVQAIELSGDMTRLTLTNKSVSGLSVYGVWVNDATGVTVDCMSLRGNSGITHRAVDKALARDMARFVDYDLIVVEFGINALSSKQKDYSNYGRLMGRTLSALKAAYPNADIILMGVGDRGQKSGGEVHSLPTIQNMVDTQRETARKAGVIFWDTRQAMGGDDAVVRWRDDKLINADYIHLNAKGGAALARLFTNALYEAL